MAKRLVQQEEEQLDREAALEAGSLSLQLVVGCPVGQQVGRAERRRTGVGGRRSEGRVC